VPLVQAAQAVPTVLVVLLAQVVQAD